MIIQENQDAFASILVDLARSAEIAPRMLPERFGPGERYVLEELVGIGHDSHVYRAVDRHLSKPTVPAVVAIKIRVSGASARAEAIVGRSVVHDNVVRIIDHGVTDTGEPYVVQEWIDGGDLTDLNLPLQAREACELLSAIARGLQALHSAGNIHGDLKPSNVLRTKDGSPKITDFDLSSAPDVGEISVGGNLAFMAPERLLEGHGPPSPLADIYSLGGILYYFLTGRLPHGELAKEIIEHHRAAAPVEMHGIEPDLARICLRSLARAPEERYRSAEALADDLQLWLAHRPIPWTRPSGRRRAALLVRRRPLQVLIATLTAAMLCATVGWLQVSLRREVEERRREAELALAKAEADHIAYQQKEATMRAVIEGFVARTSRLVRNDNGSSVFAMLVWIDWISNSGILGERGPLLARDARVRALNELRERYLNTGQGGTLPDGMAAACLASLYLEEANIELAEAQLADAEAGPLGSLSDNDDVRRTLAAMRHIVEFERAAARGDQPAAESLGTELLARAREFARLDGMHHMLESIRGAFRRHPRYAPSEELMRSVWDAVLTDGFSAS